MLIGHVPDIAWLLACFVLAWVLVLSSARARKTWPIHAVVTTQLAAVFAAYLITPHALAMHLPTSLHRLLMQLAPCAMLALLTAMSPLFWFIVRGDHIADAERDKDASAEPIAFEV